MGGRGTTVGRLGRVALLLRWVALWVGGCAVGLLVRGRSVGVIWGGRILLSSLTLCVVGLRRVLLLAVALLAVWLLRGITTLVAAVVVVV